MSCEVWPVEWSCDTTAVPQERLDAAADAAQQLLWALSGYRVGICDYRESFRIASTGVCGGPYKDSAGNWRNNGIQGGACCRVLLSHRPVEKVVEVVDGGTVLDPSLYALEGSWLRRRGACWAVVAPCDDPELIVAYQSGVHLPPGTAVAMGEVACEYLNAFSGDPCRLPARATSITRQGVTVVLDTASDFVKIGKLGLPAADAWLEVARGAGPRVASRVYSPDLARGVRA